MWTLILPEFHLFPLLHADGAVGHLHRIHIRAIFTMVKVDFGGFSSILVNKVQSSNWREYQTNEENLEAFILFLNTDDSQEESD